MMKKEKTYLPIDITMPGYSNINTKETEKLITSNFYNR